jgi:HEAT repeat protein
MMARYLQRLGLILLLLCSLTKTEAHQQQDTEPQYPLTSVSDLSDEELESWLVFDANQPSLLVRSLMIIIVISTVSLIILLVWILINRNRMQARQFETDQLMEQFQSLLIDYLFSEHDEEEFKRIQRIANSDFNRKILINQMIDLSINLSGEAKGKLRDLYLRMKLDQDSIRKVYSSKWHIQIKGFKELAFMNITEANDKIRQTLKSKNNILRMEAQLALVRLNQDDPFGFLDHLEQPFTLWEQLNVHELITFHNLPVPDFSRWTVSPNKSVVIFALRMIQVFKQQDAAPAIIKTLQHNDEDIRHMAIQVCGEIQLRETLLHLKHMYKNEEYRNCCAIVQTMGKMPDEMMLGFLKLVLDKEEDVQLQIEAAMAINKMGEVGIAALVKLMKSEYKNYQIIIRHVLDKRIS